MTLTLTLMVLIGESVHDLNLQAGTGAVTLVPSGALNPNTPITIPVSDSQISFADADWSVVPLSLRDNRGPKWCTPNHNPNPKGPNGALVLHVFGVGDIVSQVDPQHPVWCHPGSL